MADPDRVYRAAFGGEEVRQHAHEFDRGIDNGAFLIRTEGSKKAATRSTPSNDAIRSFVSNSREFTPRTFFRTAPTATFTFSFPAPTQQQQQQQQQLPMPPHFRATPAAAAASATGSRPLFGSARNYDDSDFEASLTDSAMATDGGGGGGGGGGGRSFARGMRDLRRGRRELSNMKQGVEVVSKEVVEDGGMPLKKPVEYVSLANASKIQAKRNFAALMGEGEDLCCSSCDELEEKLAQSDRDEARKRSTSDSGRHRRRRRAKVRGTLPPGVAPESIDELSTSEVASVGRSSSSNSAGGGSGGGDDDDGDGDDEGDNEEMYYSLSETMAQLRGDKSKRRKRTSKKDATSNESQSLLGGGGRGAGGDGGGGQGTQMTAGRNASSAMNCFLCRYGNRRHDAINRPDMMKLLEVLEEGIGHSNPLALARTVHLQYMSTIFVDGRFAGVRMPVWRTKDVLEHILYHENDPRIVIWLQIIKKRQMIDCCESTAFERSPETGALVPTKYSALGLKHEEHLLRLYSARPETMNFYAPSAQINLGKANRRVEGVYARRTPKHYAHTVVAELEIH